MENYIIPKIIEYSKKTSFSRSREDYEIEIDTIIKDSCIITAEGGIGKTTLLKEIEIKTNHKYIDVKEYQNDLDSLFNLINNQPNTTFCLDAIDELDSSTSIKFLIRIKNIFNNSKFILSCRPESVNELEKYLPNNVKVYEIQPFSISQIKKFLKFKGITHRNSDKILNRFKKSYRIEFIDIPRFLDAIVLLISQYQKSQKTIEDVLGLTYTDYLEEIVYAELNAQKEKINTEDKIEPTKRILESLALNMQIYQRYEITKDELMTFFSDVQSDLKAFALPLKEFYEFNLIKETRDKKGIEFKNKDFQNYLAAKEINRLSKSEIAFFDLAFDTKLNSFYTNWIGTTKYLLQLNPIWRRSSVGRPVSTKTVGL